MITVENAYNKGKLNIAAVETERVFNYKLVDFVLFLVYDKEKTSEILRRNEKSPTKRAITFKLATPRYSNEVIEK